MTKLIRKAPLHTLKYAPRGFTLYTVNGMKPFVWVALGLPGETAPHDGARCFPAVIDTGSNQSLSIKEETLISIFGTSGPALSSTMTGFHTSRLLKNSNRGRFFNASFNVFLMGTEVILQPQAELLPDRSRFALLELDKGIEVYPQLGTASDNFRPEIPILGMHAIFDNQVHFSTNGRSYSLEVLPKWWRQAFG